MYLAAAVLSGFMWWLFARLLGWGLFGGGMYNPYRGTELVIALLTAILIAYLSKPLYSKPNWKHLFWWIPISVYLAVGLFIAISFLLKIILFGPDVTGRAWSSDSGTTIYYEQPEDFLGMVLGVWWLLTFLLPYNIFFMGLSWLNHWGMRSLLLYKSLGFRKFPNKT